MHITEKVAGVDGFLTDAEASILYRLALQAPARKDGVILEIGSWKGKSTICLASGSLLNSKMKVYAVDPHTGSEEHQQADKKVWTFDEFTKNIKDAKVSDFVSPVLKTSQDAAKEFKQPIQLLFIDGDHSYEGVKTDFDLWFPKVVNGGVIAFHDTIGWQGPRRLVNQEVFRGRQFKNARFAGSITYATKVKENTRFDRLKNFYVLQLKHVTELANGVTLPRPLRRLGGRIVRSIQG